jgi:N-acetylglucosamine malate deacetylase 1
MPPLLDVFGSSPRRALIVAPHADDEVLGAGGLICNLSQKGWDIHVLYATVSGYASLARGDFSQTTGRTAEVAAALKVLGVAGYEALFLGETHHLRLDTVPQCELVQFVEKWIAGVRPSLVVLPCRGHYHQDHRAVAEAGIAALRPAPDGRLPFVPMVLAYGHAAAGWGGGSYEFHPALFVDITRVMEAKIQALACYESQICAVPHPRSLDSVRNWAAAWGGYAGVAYAEPFECLRLAVL